MHLSIPKMKLNLKRPLAFFDLETTGVNVGVDRIVEISIIKVHIDGSEEVKTWRVNPEMQIPLEASLVHGIYHDDIKDEPTFETLAPQIIDFIAESDLAGYNSNKFDIPMLVEECLRVGIVFDLNGRYTVDVQNIFHQMEQRTLKAAYKFYCNKQIINAHSAEADTRATVEVLLAQIDRYADAEFEDKKGNRSKPIVNDVEALHKFTNLNSPVDFAGRMVYNDKREELFNFGKHKGKKVEDILNIEPSYYSWMMQGDFPLYTKCKLNEIYNRVNAKKIAERKAAKLVEQQQTDNKKVAHTDNKPADKKQSHQPKKEFQKPVHNEGQPAKPIIKKKSEPTRPVNEDMLKMLADKFKNG